MKSPMQFLARYRHALLYGCVMALLVFILKWLQWKFLITENSLEIYIGLLAVFFTAFGVWIASQLIKPRKEEVIVEREVYVAHPATVNEAELARLELSPREYEVLQLITQGYSNAEIAGKLFLSVSTIKTHVSSLFVKMDVRSRTQALEKARRLRIVP